VGMVGGEADGGDFLMPAFRGRPKSWKMSYWKFGPVLIRYGSEGMAKWGYPRLEIGGLSFGAWTNGGDFSLAAYHPRSSITWLWFVHITKRPGRGYAATFSREELDRRANLYRAGSPHASKPRWFHRFWQPDALRRGQWNDFLRLPFGLTAIIGHQARMPWKATTPARNTSQIGEG